LSAYPADNAATQSGDDCACDLYLDSKGVNATWAETHEGMRQVYYGTFDSSRLRAADGQR
jgi:hypothetical protein